MDGLISESYQQIWVELNIEQMQQVCSSQWQVSGGAASQSYIIDLPCTRMTWRHLLQAGMLVQVTTPPVAAREQRLISVLVTCCRSSSLFLRRRLVLSFCRWPTTRRDCI